MGGPGSKFSDKRATGVINFPGKTAVTARAHARLRLVLVGWPSSLDNTGQRSTFLTLIRLHSTKQYTLNFTRQGGQMLSTLHYTVNPRSITRFTFHVLAASRICIVHCVLHSNWLNSLPASSLPVCQ